MKLDKKANKERHFNTAGANQADMEYTLPPMERVNWQEFYELIELRRYFILHAPRQTGKTTLLGSIMQKINEEGNYLCLYANIETAQTSRNDVAAGNRTVVSAIGRNAEIYLQDGWLAKNWRNILKEIDPQEALADILSQWAHNEEKPIILLLDEIDALVGDTLISVLRQLRSGYYNRPDAFPSSVILCGIRDVRDYRIHRSDGEIITGGSAFNIKAKSVRLADFSPEDVRKLYGMHTEETGQIFEENIFDYVWLKTHGQPWLVNALANEVTYTMIENRDRTKPITLAIMEEACENLIERRDTHLDQLIHKLREPRVKSVIEPMVAVEDIDTENLSLDDIQYTIDLGLIRKERGRLVISNDIYKEIVPRELTAVTQLNIASRYEPSWYVAKDGSLDMNKLIEAFSEFFRENADSWIQMFDYKEAGPQLLLQAFLQRIVNGGGIIEREYGLGRGRVDLFVRRPYENNGQTLEQRVVIELKIMHKSMEKTIDEGLRQASEYADKCGTSEAHLIIFDRTVDKPWEEKIFVKYLSFNEREITVWGL